jgi:hypothetical protein
MKYNLGFISDSDLYQHTLQTVSKFGTGMTLDEFRRNIIDPIKLTFDAHVYQRKIENVIDAEIARQLGKTNENLIGYFHQHIFRYVGKGWEVPETGQDGWDVENHARNIFAELKSKHNTMNSSSAKSVHAHMRGLVEGNSRAVCYLVEIVAKRSQDIEWCLRNAPLRQDRQSRLRRISIDRFYEIVTGDANAFRNLCQVLGRVIDDIIKEQPQAISRNSVLSELQAQGDDIMRTLFMMSFASYRGFDDFTIS